MGRKRGLGLVPVQPQLDYFGRLSEEYHSLFVGHLRDRNIVDGHNFVARFDATVIQGRVPHQSAHAVPQDGFVLLAKSESQRTLLLGEDDFELLWKMG